MQGQQTAPCWAVIPAAGIGQRMQSSCPKQYLPLAGKPLLQRTLETLLSMPELEGIVVALAENDHWWAEMIEAAADARVHATVGGALRAESVLAGLTRVAALAGEEVRVLVHDAARPLVAVSDIRRLLDAVDGSDAVGGLLAAPVQDTLKRAGASGQVETTVAREGLWQAQTPQYFPLAHLRKALIQARDEGVIDTITDEASALERTGARPLLVEARQPNLKITRPADLGLAEALLLHERSA